MTLTHAKTLLTYENPRRAQLEPLIEGARNGRGKFLKTPYVGLTWDYLGDERFEHAFGELRETMRKKLQGKTLVDLGCNIGFSRWQTREIILNMRIAKYIGVDLDTKEIEYEQDGVKISIMQTEMLNFISRLPTASVNFMLTGIDSSVINVKGYTRELAAELYRATEKGGLVFGSSSEVFRFLEETGFERIFSDYGTRFNAFEKK